MLCIFIYFLIKNFSDTFEKKPESAQLSDDAKSKSSEKGFYYYIIYIMKIIYIFIIYFYSLIIFNKFMENLLCCSRFLMFLESS